MVLLFIRASSVQVGQEEVDIKRLQICGLFAFYFQHVKLIKQHFPNNRNKKRKQQKLLPGLTASFINTSLHLQWKLLVQIVSQIFTGNTIYNKQ